MIELSSFDRGYHALMIDQAGEDVFKQVREYIRLFQKSVISYEVVPPYCLEGKSCYGCGQPFERPEKFPCGISLVIEFCVDRSDRIYHTTCRTHDRWWHTVIHSDEQKSQDEQSQQLDMF